MCLIIQQARNAKILQHIDAKVRSDNSMEHRLEARTLLQQCSIVQTVHCSVGRCWVDNIVLNVSDFVHAWKFSSIPD